MHSEKPECALHLGDAVNLLGNTIFPENRFEISQVAQEDVLLVTSPKNWEAARWVNGMEAVKTANEPQKTVVCGHWHSSYGHANFEGKGTEFGKEADFSPYYADGIIAIDACTAASGKVNCIVLEDVPV